ncbi:hypothetical protein N9C56_00210 [Paracoccaceae bacterium]|nr:hypothetical protein [Paracoccaceae bacterium]
MAEQRGQDLRQYVRDVDGNLRGIGNYPYGLQEQLGEKVAAGRFNYIYYSDDKRVDGTPIVKPRMRPASLSGKPQYDIDETVPPTLGEKYKIMKLDRLNRAARAGATGSQIRTMANDFDELVVQGSINAIGQYVATAKDPHRAYLDVLEHPKIAAGIIKPKVNTGLPPHLQEAFDLLVNMDDRQKVIDNALKAWTDAQRLVDLQAKAAINKNKADIRKGEKAFNVLLSEYGSEDLQDADFLEQAQAIIDDMGALGYDAAKLEKMESLIVTTTVFTEESTTGTSIVYAPRSVSDIKVMIERRILREDPSLGLGELADLLADKQLSYEDYLDLSKQVVGVMDENVKDALASVRPALPEGLQLFSTQQNAQLNRYTALKKDLLKQQRLAVLQETEFNPFVWVENNKDNYFNTEQTSAEDQLILDLQPYTFNSEVLGSVALDAAIEASTDEFGASADATKALVELKDRARAYITSGKTIQNWNSP